MNEDGISATCSNHNRTLKDRKRDGAVNGTLLKNIDGSFATNNIPAHSNAAPTDASSVMTINCTRTSQLGHQPGAEDICGLGKQTKTIIRYMTGSSGHGMRKSDRADSRHCAMCTAAKQCNIPSRCNFLHHSESATIHEDIIGLIPAESVGGKRYCLTTGTAPHCYVQTSVIKIRADTANYIYYLIARVNRNTKCKTKRFHCDNASKFVVLRKRLGKLGTV